MTRNELRECKYARIIAEIHRTQRISYDDLSVRLDLDRLVVIQSVKRLVHAGRLQIVERGRGAIPHQYAVCE